MITRNGNEADVLFIKSLLGQLGYPDLGEAEIRHRIRLHATPGYDLKVAVIDNAVVGFIAVHWFELFHTAGPIGRISAFCVDGHFRGNGIGKLLLAESEQLFRSKGCVKVEVTSNARRTLTHEFYLKRGYLDDSRRFVKYI